MWGRSYRLLVLDSWSLFVYMFETRCRCVALVMRMTEKTDLLLRKCKFDQFEIMEKLHRISNM